MKSKTKLEGSEYAPLTQKSCCYFSGQKEHHVCTYILNNKGWQEKVQHFNWLSVFNLSDKLVA